MSSTSTDNFSAGLLCPQCGAALGDDLVNCSCGWELHPGARAKATEEAEAAKQAEANKPIPLADEPGMPDLDVSMDDVALQPIELVPPPIQSPLHNDNNELPAQIYTPDDLDEIEPIPLEHDVERGGDTPFHERSAVVKLAARQAASNEPLEFADDSSSSSDSGADGSDSTAGGMKVVDEKVCCKCGKNVAGHRRFHDEHGYWCYDCNKASKQSEKPQGVRCRGGCGRIVPEGALVDYEGKRVCKLCAAELRREAKERKRFAPVDTSNYKTEDKRTVLILLAVFAVLLSIIILRLCHVIGY